MHYETPSDNQYIFQRMRRSQNVTINRKHYYYTVGTDMARMSYLYCLLIYVLTVALIGCQPIDTCYDEVSGTFGEPPEGWMRMNQVKQLITFRVSRR